jgi:hypothetical protein
MIIMVVTGGGLVYRKGAHRAPSMLASKSRNCVVRVKGEKSETECSGKEERTLAPRWRGNRGDWGRAPLRTSAVWPVRHRIDFLVWKNGEG